MIWTEFLSPILVWFLLACIVRVVYVAGIKEGRRREKNRACGLPEKVRF